LFIDYSPDLFAPVFGFKGIEVQGDVDRLNYEGFVIKHSLNSFASRLLTLAKQAAAAPKNMWKP
jgi:hypothetical protein